jgi:hypothetical protein
MARRLLFHFSTNWWIGHCWRPMRFFSPTPVFDIYSSVVGELGPYGFTGHRKAVMLEVLRVLAGRETMWDWNHGVDTDKKVAKKSHNEEAGAFQVSADSMDLDKSLKDFAQETLGATDDTTFTTGRNPTIGSRWSTRPGSSGSPSRITGRSSTVTFTPN